jgi:folate-binding protein YgfZ
VTAAVDLRTRLGAVRTSRDVVWVSGPDAAAYLQGQASQDVATVPVGATTWSFVLQPTGKVEAWVRVTRTEDDRFLLDTDAGAGAGEALMTRLRRFLLRTKAEVEAATWPCVAVRGPGAEAGLDGAAAPGAGSAGGLPLRLPTRWPGAEGVDVLGPDVEVPDGVAEAGVDDLESLRIRCGVPAMGRELTDRTIPAEAGQWVVDASVSFTKGCFTGQELVARIDSRGGNVPRHLRAVRAAGGELDVGAALVAGDAEVGALTSVAPHPAGGTVGLAYVGRAVEPPAEVVARGPSGDVAATVLATPLPD